MPKRVFWPIALIVMGLIFLASRLQLLPVEFANLWPVMLIIVGLGGLLISDREEWLVENTSSRASTARTSRKKPSRKSTRKK